MPIERTAEQERAAIVAWLLKRRTLICTGVAILICVALFKAGGEAFAALILSIWALHLAEDIDELNAQEAPHAKDENNG